MDCDFCLDMDVSGSEWDDYGVEIRSAPKAFKCCECSREFPAGSKQEAASGIPDDGQREELLTCMDCHHIAEGLICGSRCHGSLYDAIEQMLDDGATFTTACLAKVETVTAKKYLVEWINVFNGLKP